MPWHPLQPQFLRPCVVVVLLYLKFCLTGWFISFAGFLIEKMLIYMFCENFDESHCICSLCIPYCQNCVPVLKSFPVLSSHFQSCGILSSPVYYYQFLSNSFLSGPLMFSLVQSCPVLSNLKTQVRSFPILSQLVWLIQPFLISLYQ